MIETFCILAFVFGTVLLIGTMIGSTGKRLAKMGQDNTQTECKRKMQMVDEKYRLKREKLKEEGHKLDKAYQDMLHNW